MMIKTLACFGILALGLCGLAQGQDGAPPDSGGVLRPSQAAFDVRFYDLALRVDPKAKRIDGKLAVRFVVRAPLRFLDLDLDQRLTVHEAVEAGQKLPFEHEDGRVAIDLGTKRAVGATLTVELSFGGQPRAAPNPPWEGGFTWSKTPSGAEWFATSCQMNGADLWWPCKDHPSDEPEDGMALHFRLPRPLVAASNGHLESVEEHDDGTRTFNWRVSSPINSYAVALCAAPYDVLKTTMKSVTGEVFPIEFYALPKHSTLARQLLDEIKDHLHFFEELFGPYPFRKDKYGVAETPFLGMEHQTLIAYGYGFKKDRWGYDWLHHHELSHEWWGNLVTAPDWKDFWIHEGFGTYCQDLYVEKLHGPEAYRKELTRQRRLLSNRYPVAPLEPTSARRMSRGGPGLDVYYKGAWILHSLRWLIGRKALIDSMRQLCYRDAAAEKVVDGSQCHFATTEDFQALCEKNSGQELGWFFALYLRQPKLPRLRSDVEGDTLKLWWETPADLPFPMPVELRLGDQTLRVEMKKGRGSVRIPGGANFDPARDIDPKRWILRRYR